MLKKILRNFTDENNLLMDEYSPFQDSGKYPDLLGQVDPKLRTSILKETFKSAYKRSKKRKRT